jgi:hypothetical protein
MSDQRGKVLSFDPFELSIENRLLTNGAKVVPLGARAMDLLIVLMEHANKVVGRRTLIERGWPKRGAEQVSLRVHNSRGPESDGPIYSRFTEGPATPDLILAKRMLEQTSVRARQSGRRVAKSSGRAKA